MNIYGSLEFVGLEFNYRSVLYVLYILLLLLLLLKSNPSRQHSKVLYRWGKGKKDRKTWKSRSEKKGWVLAQPPYSPHRNGRQSHRV